MRFVVRLLAGCNFFELVYRRLIFWRVGRTYSLVLGYYYDNRNVLFFLD